MIKGYNHKIKKLIYEAKVLYRCSQDKRLPWYKRWMAYSVAFYVLGQMDVIPDFVPLIGYLDDFLLVPAGVAIAKWLIPEEIYEENRKKPRTYHIPVSEYQWLIETVLVVFWAAILMLLYLKFLKQPVHRYLFE